MAGRRDGRTAGWRDSSMVRSFGSMLKDYEVVLSTHRENNSSRYSYIFYRSNKPQG